MLVILVPTMYYWIPTCMTYDCPLVCPLCPQNYLCPVINMVPYDFQVCFYALLMLSYCWPMDVYCFLLVITVVIWVVSAVRLVAYDSHMIDIWCNSYELHVCAYGVRTVSCDVLRCPDSFPTVCI